MSANQEDMMQVEPVKHPYSEPSVIRATISIPEKSAGNPPDDKLIPHEFSLIPNEWQKLSVQLSDPDLLVDRLIEIHPLNQSGLVSISNIRLVDVENNVSVWSAHDDFSKCTVNGEAQAVYHEAGLQIVCYGEKSKLQLPSFSDLPDTVLNLEVWIRPDQDYTGLARNWNLLISRLNKLRDQNKYLENKVQSLELECKNQRDSIQELRDNFLKEINQLKYDLHAQKTMTSRYFNELASAEKLLNDQSSLQARNKVISKQNKNLLKHNKDFYLAIVRLEKELNNLVSSARWRTGNAFIRLVERVLLREQQPLSVDGMSKEIFELKQKYKKNYLPGGKKKDAEFSRKSDELLNLVLLLQKDIKLIKCSARWRVGNLLIKLFEILTFKPGKRSEFDRLQGILEKIATQVQEGKSADPEILERKLEKIYHEFKKIKSSTRWRVGDSLFSFVDKLLLRSGKPTAMDHALKLLARYENESQ